MEFDPDLTNNNQDSAETVVGNAAPEIEVSPLQHDFGPVAEGDRSDPVEITIANLGTADLEVSLIRNSDPTHFILVTNAGSMPCSPVRPFILVPTARCTFTVTFVPSAQETVTAEATIESSDADEPAVAVTLLGSRAASDGPVPTPDEDGGCDCAATHGGDRTIWLSVGVGLLALSRRRWGAL